jgi:AraC-like DNA-binding protein
LLWVKCSEAGLETWICHSEGERHWIGDVTARVVIPSLGARHFFAMLEQEARHRTLQSAWICHGLLKVLFGIILSQLRIHPDFLTNRKRSFVSHGDNWNPISFAQEYVRANLGGPLTIREVARASYMAESVFIVRFRRETGKTFNQFVTECRLERAQTLLRDTDWAMAPIASQVGVNPSHLRRLFARYLRTSPQQFRKRSQAQARAQFNRIGAEHIG